MRLRTTTVSASMPAATQARALSYSQLVPGNTGITARGFAIPLASTAGAPLSQEMGAAAPPSPATVGYTGSRTLSLRRSSSSTEALSLPMVMVGSAVVTPIFSQQGRETSSASSAMIMPGMGPHQGAPASGSEAKPTPLPKDIFMTASAVPFSTAQAARTFPSFRRLPKASQAALWAA